MKTIVVVTEDQWVTTEIKLLWKAAKKRSIPFHLICPYRCSLDISEGFLINPKGEKIVPDIVLGRLGMSSLSVGVPLLEMIQSINIPVVNGGMTHLRGRNKAIAAGCFIRSGLPHPPSWYLSAGSLHKMKNTLPYPLVLKPMVGSRGDGIHLLRHATDVHYVIRHLPPPFFVQKLIRPIKHEKRLFTMGDRVIGGVLKQPAPGEWRGNQAAGATFHRTDIGRDEASVALAAARTLGADIAGIDLVMTEEGPVLLEVNVCPQFEGLSVATGVDVAGEMINYLRGD